MRLFKIEEFTPVATEECLSMAPFQKLMTLNYNREPEDQQGRKRLRGSRELRFIYYYCDYRSEFANFSQKDRQHHAFIAAGMDSDEELSIELQKAIKFYTKININRSIETLLSARKATDELKNYFNSIKLEFKDTDTEDQRIAKSNLAGKLMDNIGKLPTAIKKLEELEEKIRKDESSETSIRGDAEGGRLS